LDAAYKSVASRKWESIEIKDWRGGPVYQENEEMKDYNEAHFLIKEEKMLDGELKVISKDKQTGKISQIIQ
jgi:hypothetical protein